MKTLKLIPLLLLLATACTARSAEINWWTFTGGGGKAQNGSVALGGAIGPIAPALSPATGGNYSLKGGFWSLLSLVQTPGAPSLTITLTATNTALVSWPSPSAGFSLQQNTNGSGSVNWSNLATPPTDNGIIKYIIVNPPTGNRFYRLVHP